MRGVPRRDRWSLQNNIIMEIIFGFLAGALPPLPPECRRSSRPPRPAQIAMAHRNRAARHVAQFQCH